MSSDHMPQHARFTGPESQDQLLTLLRHWGERDWLRPLDVAFAEFLCREAPDASPLLILAATLASHQLGRGHVCLDLEATLKNPTFALSLPPEDAETQDDDPSPRPAEVLEGLTLPDWQAALVYPDLVGPGPGATPLVLAGPRLYLRRYWGYEQAVRIGIHDRLARATTQMALPVETMRQILDGLFPPTATQARLAEARLRPGGTQCFQHHHWGSWHR